MKNKRIMSDNYYFISDKINEQEILEEGLWCDVDGCIGYLFKIRAESYLNCVMIELLEFSPGDEVTLFEIDSKALSKGEIVPDIMGREYNCLIRIPNIDPEYIRKVDNMKCPDKAGYVYSRNETAVMFYSHYLGKRPIKIAEDIGVIMFCLDKENNPTIAQVPGGLSTLDNLKVNSNIAELKKKNYTRGYYALTKNESKSN